MKRTRIRAKSSKPSKKPILSPPFLRHTTLCAFLMICLYPHLIAKGRKHLPTPFFILLQSDLRFHLHNSALIQNMTTNKNNNLTILDTKRASYKAPFVLSLLFYIKPVHLGFFISCFCDSKSFFHAFLVLNYLVEKAQGEHQRRTSVRVIIWPDIRMATTV